jgi:hypothetical protein
LQPRPYSFNYGVKDEYSGVEYNRAETRGDQGVTRGEYTVALPDGRTQIVSYVGKWGAEVGCQPQSAYFTREETGSVYLPTQLERKLQLYW